MRREAVPQAIRGPRPKEGRFMKQHFRVVSIMIGTMLFSLGAPAFAGDRHVGIYYPEPRIHEEYKARAKTLSGANRSKRIGFVNGLTAYMLASPYPPQFSVFAKGVEAEKLIIVGLYDNSFNTLYRARALLAMLTALSRQTPYFKKNEVDDRFTFFDLLVLLGFKKITVSNGDAFAYQVTFK